MKKIKFLVLSTILVVVSLMLFLGLKLNNNRAINLTKALEIATSKAKNWDSRAELMSLSSVDNPDLIVSENGHDGNRRYWNFIFIVPGSGKQLILTIHDKKIVNNISSEVPIINDEFIRKEEINITSQEAVKKCIEYFNTKPGKDWAGGYHFTLNKQNNIVVLSIICLDKEDYFTRISFNATTKQLISANRKIPKGGGVFKENSKFDLNNGKQVSVLGASISPNFVKDNSIIVWYLINPYKQNMYLTANITRNDGISWETINIKEDFLKIFFSDAYATDNLIYAITRKGLIVSSDYGHTWKQIFASQLEILDCYTVGQKILLRTEKEIYVSSDKGVSWNRLDTQLKADFVNIDFNGDIYIVSNNRILKKINNSWIDMNAPISGNILDIKMTTKYLVAYTSDSVNILNIKNNKWDVVSNINGIENIFVDLNNQIYCLVNNSLIKLEKDNLTNLWTRRKININAEGKLVDLLCNPMNNLYFCMSSNQEWEYIERR